MTNKEAIRVLKAIKEHPSMSVYLPDEYEALDLAIEALEERPQGEWIPVIERLPEERINTYTKDFEYVLCSTIWGDVRPYRFGKRIGENKAHFWLGGGIMDKYITAWQLFPEPYEKGGRQ